MPNALPTLRRATNADGAAAFTLVAAALREFGLTPDPSGTDADLADFEQHYFVRGGDFAVLIDGDGNLVGTCGLYPLTSSSSTGIAGSPGHAAPPPRSIELRKMYLAPELRGQGQGRRLLEWAIGRARELGFRHLRLETACVLKDAIALYERNGFRRDDSQLHTCRCDTAYVRNL